MVDLIEDDDVHTTDGIHPLDKFREHLVRRPAGERDLVFETFDQRIAEVGQHPILGVDVAAIDEDRVDDAP